MPQKPCIAIVDDDENVRSSIQNFFLAAGLKVNTFSSAESFLASPAKEATNCLVTDLHMPGLNGLELQRKLRIAGYAMAVIVMTGFPSEEARREAADLGAAAFMEKPVDPDELLEQVEMALS